MSTQGIPDNLDELHERCQYIQYLESELKSATQDVVRLESELATDKDPMMQAKVIDKDIKGDPTAKERLADLGSEQYIPIHRLDDELLYFLFKVCISLQHDDIGALLQVCQRWYTIIMNSPKLWARIQILDGHSLFNSPRRPSRLSYILACVERSRGLPLEVELRITGLPPCDGFVQWLMTEYAVTIADPGEHVKLQNQIMGQEWKFESEIYERQLDRAIEFLVGKDRIGIKRWESVVLELPNTKDVGVRVWRGLVGAFPNVTKFVASNIPELSPIEGELRSTRMELPIIKDLKVHQDLKTLPLKFNPTTIKVLRIDFNQDLDDLLCLSEFTELEEAWLTGVHTSPRNPERFTIRLPTLRKLTLSGHYDWLQPLQFELPRLEDLVLRNWHGIRPLPSLSPRRVVWRPLQWDPPTFVTALRNISSLAGSVEVIEVDPSSMALKARAYPTFNEKGSRLKQVIISKMNEELAVLSGMEFGELLETVEKLYYAKYRS